MATRSDAAVEIARSAGTLACEYFARVARLIVDQKGPQDYVSEADRSVELHIRAAIEAAFPGDGIVGEEHAPKASDSGYTWVIDPIDGTTNFVSAIPAWTIVIAVVRGSDTEIGVTYDPIHDEMYLAKKGQGAFLNGTAMTPPPDRPLQDGSLGTGYSNRVSTVGIARILQSTLNKGGIFHRNASGALSLAYVAGGRLIGYVEEHMNAWDCLAGQLLIAEAGGRVEDQDAQEMIARGGRVVVGNALVFDELVAMADAAFGAQAR